MADKKISDLNQAGSLDGTEDAAVVQSGETKKLSVAEWARTDGTLGVGDIGRMKSVGPLVVEKMPTPAAGVTPVWDGSQWTSPDDRVATVTHAADATVARPDANIVMWIGSVEPNNATTDDRLYRTDLDEDYRYDGTSFALIFSGTYRKDAAAVWVGSPGTVSSGTPALTTIQGLTPARAMDPDTVEGISFAVWLPDSWATYDVEFWWANAGTGSGDVEWRYIRKNITEGEDSGAATGTTVVDTAGAQDVTQRVTVATGVTNDSDELTSILVRRIASSGSDTLANDAYFIGARFTKAS